MTFFDNHAMSIIAIITLLIIVYAAFIYSTTNRHAHRAALAWIANELNLVDYHYQANLRTVIRNLDKTLNFCSADHFAENIKHDAKLINDAETDLLTSRQQLFLLDELLGTTTKLHQASKITRARTARDVIEIAVKHVRDDMVCTAPQALFR